MILPPAFTEDLSDLPTHAFSHRALTWWGLIGFMLIEGTAFAMAIAAYFFLMSAEQSWAPQPWHPPGLGCGDDVHANHPGQRNPEHDDQDSRREL